MESGRYQLALEVVEQVYLSVSDPDSWSATVQAIAIALKADGCSIWFSDLTHPDISITASTIHDLPSMLSTYNAKHSLNNSYFPALRALPQNCMYTSEQVMPREELLQTPLYLEFWKQIGIEYAVGGFLCKEGQVEAVIQVWRSAAPAFDNDDTALLNLLRPHLSGALKLRSEFLLGQSLAESGMHALNRMGLAMILLDESGSCLIQSASVDQLQADGVLYFENSKLHLRAPKDDLQLQALMADHGQGTGEGGALLLRHGHDQREMEALVLPYQGELALQSTMRPVRTVVFLRYVDAAPIPREELLSQLYQLTAAEVRVCLALVSGQSPREIAEGQGVSLEAIRFHCKNIFRKTGNRRQADLIRHLSRSLAGLAGN